MKRDTAGEPDLFRGSTASSGAETRWPPDDEIPASLSEARRMAAACTRCDLYKNATQTVFGEGPASAKIMMVGEQPGDQEDLQGHPFVGPAGKVLDRALVDAGIDRRVVYVTNGVKHFKNEPRGKRRLHKRPSAEEIKICRWWLGHELRLVRPRVVVALGASGLAAVIGRTTSVTSMRGQESHLQDGSLLVVTVHPSYLLRMPDRAAAEMEYGRFVDDLRRARSRIGR